MNKLYIEGHVLDKEITEARAILSSHSTPQEIKQAYAAHLEGLLAIVRATLGDEPLVGTPPGSALTKEDLMTGDWWCGDISQYSAKAFAEMGIEVYWQEQWTTEKTIWQYCRYSVNHVSRYFGSARKGHEVIRKGSKFYWRSKL